MKNIKLIFLILLIPFIGYSQGGFPGKPILDGTEKIRLFAEPGGNMYVTAGQIANLDKCEAVTGFSDGAIIVNDGAGGLRLATFADTSAMTGNCPQGYVFGGCFYRNGDTFDSALADGSWYFDGSQVLTQTPLVTAFIPVLSVAAGRATVTVANNCRETATPMANIATTDSLWIDSYILNASGDTIGTVINERTIDGTINQITVEKTIDYTPWRNEVDGVTKTDDVVSADGIVTFQKVAIAPSEISGVGNIQPVSSSGLYIKSVGSTNITNALDIDNLIGDDLVDIKDDGQLRGNQYIEHNFDDQRPRANIGVDIDGNFIMTEPAMKYSDFFRSPVENYGLVGNTLSGTAKWIGGVLHPNGKIYGIPNSSTQVLEFDPATNTSILVGNTLAGTGKWYGGVLHPNGKIYGIPINATQVLEFDPATNTSILVGDILSGSAKWAGGVLHPNGKIYGIPYNSSQVLEFDPITNTSVLVGNTLSGTAKWIGGVLHQNGKIYGISHSSTQVLEFDPITNTSTLVGNTLSGTSKWGGGVLHPNGKIYGIPQNSTQVLEFNPITNTSTLVGNTITGIGKWAGGVLHPNGKIYGIPNNSTQVLEFNPATNTSTLVGGTLTDTGKWIGGVLHPNGKIYGIPVNASQVLEISPAWSQQAHSIIDLISPYLNKF